MNKLLSSCFPARSSAEEKKAEEKRETKVEGDDIPKEELERQALALLSQRIPGSNLPVSFSFAFNDESILFLDNEKNSNLKQLCVYDWKKDGEGSKEQKEEARVNDGNKRVFFNAKMVGKSGDNDENLTLEEKLRRERARQMTLGVTSYVKNTTRDKILIPLSQNWYAITANTQEAAELVLNGEEGVCLDASFSPLDNYVVFARGNDLWVKCFPNSGNDVLINVSEEKEAGVTNGQASYLAQEEMDRDRGYWMSLSENFLAYERVDERNVKTYSIKHYEDDDVKEEHHYPFCGKTNPLVELILFDMRRKERKKIDLQCFFPDEEIYLNRVDWFDNDLLFIQIQNRKQKTLKLILYDAISERTRVLLEEEATYWINLHYLFKPFKRDKQSDKINFIFGSERNGFSNLYLFEFKETSNDLAKCLRNVSNFTNGVVEELIGLDLEREKVYFTGNESLHMEKHFYVADLNENTVHRLSPDGFTHVVCAINRSFSHLIVSSSSLSRPPVISLVQLNGNKFDLNECPLFVSDLKAMDEFHKDFPQPKQITTMVDNIPLYSHVYIPTRMSPKTVFPTVVVVYGGPHVARVRNEWLATVDIRCQMLRKSGYLVVKTDNRGSSRRGVHFEGKINGNMGEVELLDQIEVLNKLEMVDMNRVGITGWSYGGYLSAMGICRYGDVFKVAIAGAPVISWSLYDTHYTERYMQTEEENEVGFLNSNVVSHVENLKGKLLIVHGLLDENVIFKNSVFLINALIANDKQYDLLVFPNDRHGVRRFDTRKYLERAILRYFNDHL